MIIGIDGNEANIKNRVGVNVYAFKILWELYKMAQAGKNNHSLIVYLKEKPLPDLPKETKNFKYKVISGGGLWIITRLTPYLFKNPEKIQVLFSLSHYVSPFLTLPKVCSIMDLGYLESSEQFEKIVFWQLKYWTAISVFVSKQVLTISEASRKDIVRHYPFASKKIVVTPLSHDLKQKDFNVSEVDVRRIKNKYSIVDDYILYLGTLKPSKNVGGLIEAFSLLIKKYPKLKTKLVVAGKKCWLFEPLFESVKNLKLTDRVIFTGYFEEEDKQALRKGALLFAQPSFTEGFGIDTLSAMAVGVPVVVSDRGSLPEIVGKAGIVVNPDSPESIFKGMEKVLKMSKEAYNKQVKLGQDQAKKFSWEICASKTLEALEKAVKQ